MNQWLRAINVWFRLKLEAEQKALEQFERLWNDQRSGRSITFMSVALNTTSADEIQDIGLSHWSKKSIQQVAYHWRITAKVETKDVFEFGNPDSFDFGATQAITAQDVGTVLDDWTMSLSGDCEELCIVMFGAPAIKTLGRHWKSPVPVVVLDLEAVWRQQHDDEIHSTFEAVVSTSKKTANLTNNLDHAGNQAHCLIALLNSLGDGIQILCPEIEDPDIKYNI